MMMTVFGPEGTVLCLLQRNTPHVIMWGWLFDDNNTAGSDEMRNLY